MKDFSIILFSLLSIIKNHNLRILDDSIIDPKNCPDESKTINGHYCSYFNGTQIKDATEENCSKYSTYKCTNPKYDTKEECEKTYEWINGKCFKNDTDNTHEFLPKYKSKSSCEEESADWTMSSCIFYNISSGLIYENIKSSGEAGDKKDYFSEEVCKNLLNGAYTESGEKNGCYFDMSIELNEYFCDPKIEDKDECPENMNSELCRDSKGVENGTCSMGNIFGAGEKDNCKSLKKNYWKTGENEGFCYENQTLTKDSCDGTVRGKWEGEGAEWKEVPSECKKSNTASNDSKTNETNKQVNKSQFHSFKIIYLILSFIFII